MCLYIRFQSKKDALFVCEGKAVNIGEYDVIY